MARCALCGTRLRTSAALGADSRAPVRVAGMGLICRLCAAEKEGEEPRRINERERARREAAWESYDALDDDSDENDDEEDES